MMMIMVVFCQMLCVVMVMAKGVSFFFLFCLVFRFVDQGKEIGQYQNEQNEKKISSQNGFGLISFTLLLCVCVFLILFRFKCCCCCCYCCLLLLLLLLLTLFNSGRYYYRQKNKKKPPTTTSSIFVQKLELRVYTKSNL